MWESVEALRSFVFGTEHLDYLRRRREWFHHMAEAWVALWRIEVGHRPDAAEADEHLRLIRAQGPSPQSFDLKHPFAAPVYDPSSTA